MLKNAQYIYDNIIIADEINTTKKYCKKAQVGVDLTIKRVFDVNTKGVVEINKTTIPEYVEHPSIATPSYINNEEKYMFYLEKGTYIVELNEGIKLGKNNTALIIMRSSLNRCGVTIQSAVWDPGYTTASNDKIGTMSVRLTVDTDKGFIVEKNARICQILVFENEDSDLYNGQWQGGKNGL